MRSLLNLFHQNLSNQILSGFVWEWFYVFCDILLPKWAISSCQTGRWKIFLVFVNNIRASFWGTIALSYPPFLLMIHHEEMLHNPNHDPKHDPTYVPKHKTTQRFYTEV